MKLTKSKLKQIIKEEFQKLTETLPPHLQSKVDAFEKKEAEKREKFGYTVTDVTPPGYGPGPQISPSPTDEELGSLEMGTILVGRAENKIMTARKKRNGNWDIFLDEPEALIANPYLRGVNENATSRYITGMMGADYTWKIYSK